MKHDERIYSKQFRVVARHLADPQRPIEAVLHVKSISMLAALAETIEKLTANPRSTQESIRALEPLMREKALLVSFAEEKANPFSDFSIPATAIRPSVWCKVLYLPPFYLAHTPGLFEETTRLDESVQARCDVPQRHRPLRFKA